jgi:serine/threonine protein kinase
VEPLKRAAVHSPGSEPPRAAGPGLHQILDRFREACRCGDRLAVDTYLGTAAEQPALLVELVELDLESRLNAGEPARLETYLERFPALSRDRTTLLGLIATEYRLRRQREPDLPFEEYQGRFPACAEGLRAYLESGAAHTVHAPAPGDMQPTEIFTPPGTAIFQPRPTDHPGHQPRSDKDTYVPSGQAAGPPPEGGGAPAPSRVLVPGYEILAELGRGGMGVVYKARETSLKRVVALKMILAGAHAGAADLARFRSEVEAVARLHNPNIVQIYSVNEHEGFPFCALEYVDGGTLTHKLRAGPLPPRAAAELVRQLAEAIHSAHQQGVVHRDLKPDNVLLTADGVPKITDFGLAKQLNNVSKTQSGMVMGTPGYMAPEQALGRNKDVGPAADIYALGAILYEMLTGRQPFHGETPMDTMMLVIYEEPVSPSRVQPAVPRDLETVCLKCLQKDPPQRYPSGQALAEELTRFLNNEPILARPVSLPGRAWRWCRRNPVLTAVSGLAAGSAAATIVLAAGFLLSKPPGTRHPEAGEPTSPAHVSLQDLKAREGDQPWDRLTRIEEGLAQPGLTGADLTRFEKELAALASRSDPPPSPEAKRRIEVLQALAGVHDLTPARQGAAVQAVKRLLREPAPALPDKLCQALAAAAVRRPADFADARAALKDMLGRADTVVTPSEKAQIGQALRRLMTAHVKQVLPDAKGNWSELLSACAEADPADGWVVAARAECLLEQAPGPVPAEDLRQAEAAALKDPNLSQAGEYAAYVRALVYDALDQPAKAAGQLLEAYQGAPAPTLEAAGRRRRAAQVLQKAAGRLRADAGSARPLQPPLAKEGADSVYRWLTLARALDKSPLAPSLAVNLLLAAWYKAEPDAALVRQLLGELDPAAVGAGDVLPFLLVKARALAADPERHPEALHGYAELLSRLHGSPDKKHGEAQPGDLWKQVIAPGIDLGERLKVSADSPPGQRQDLVALYAAKGRLLARDPGLVKTDPYQQWYNAYDASLKLLDETDQRRAEFVVQRDIARMWQRRPDEDAFEADANAARAIDPEYPGARFLLGYVRQQQARRAQRENNAAAAERKLDESLREFSAAVDLLKRRKDPFRELPAYYMYRINSAVSLALIVADPRRREQLLRQAVADAQEALALGPSDPCAYYIAKGNALEDLAWFGGHLDKYAEAVTAFESARASRPDVARYWIDLGRCKYKVADLEGTQPAPAHRDYLKDAIKHLQEVVHGRSFQKPLTEREKAETHYWLAKALTLDHRYPEADEAFRQVLALRDEPAVGNWVQLALESSADAALDRAQEGDGLDAPKLNECLQVVRERAEALRQHRGKEAVAARLRGRAFEAERKPLKALEEYDKEVARAQEQGEAIDLRLALTRLDLLLNGKWKLELRGASRPETAPEAVAREADRLVRLADDAGFFRDWACGLAGLAHLEAVNPDRPQEEKRHRTEAAARLQRAVELSRAGKGEGWRWRFELAQQLSRSLASQEDADERERQRAKALQLAQEALDGPAPEAKKKEVQSLVRSLMK